MTKTHVYFLLGGAVAGYLFAASLAKFQPFTYIAQKAESFA